MKIAVMGAGSLGTIIGAFLSQAKADVVLIDVNTAHVQALNDKGATITGTVEKTIPVKAITPDEMTGTYDLVLLLTKQYFNDEVLRSLLPFLHEDSIVCSLQNGVPEESVASIVGRERVIAGSVEFGATYLEPGVSELTSAYEELQKFAFMVGELTGELTERLEKVKNILTHVGGTIATPNLVGTKWSKLIINASMSGLSAALNCTYGDILANEATLEYAVRVVDETVRVGHANGIVFVPLIGIDFDNFLIGANQLQEKMTEFKQVLLPHGRLKASMLQDLEKGKETEIDFINGVVVAAGKEVATPFNGLIVELVKEAESTRTVPDYAKNVEKVIALLHEK